MQIGGYRIKYGPAINGMSSVTRQPVSLHP